MNNDGSWIDAYAYEMGAGHCAIVVALVIALHENGVLPRDRYIDVLHRLWMGMPEEEAVGEAGAVIERVLDLLGAPASTAPPSDDGRRKQEISAFAGKAVNSDAVARPAPSPLKTLLHALCGAVLRA